MPDVCSRPDCGRPRQPYGRYCCNLCSARHEADLPPGHDPKCARQFAESRSDKIAERVDPEYLEQWLGPEQVDDEADANIPCTGCDCCSHTDCEQFFCSDCPCTATRQSADKEQNDA